jgi:hypothetical protein
MVLAICSTLRARSNAVWIPLFLQVFETGIVIREALQKIDYGQPKVLWNALLNFHGKDSMPFLLLGVKG